MLSLVKSSLDAQASGNACTSSLIFTRSFMSEDWCSELYPFLTMFLNIEYLNKSDFICSSVFYKLFPK